MEDIKENIQILNNINTYKNIKHYKNYHTNVSFSILNRKNITYIIFHTSKSEILNIQHGKITSVFLSILKDTTMINPFRNINSDIELDDFSFNDNKNKMYLHIGFLNLFNSISSVFFNEVYKSLESSNKIVFLGNSLGGTLARIAYLYSVLFYYKYSDKFSLYTYGATDLGNKFTESFFLSLNKLYKSINIIEIENDPFTVILNKYKGYAKYKEIIRIKFKDALKFDTREYTEALKRINIILKTHKK